MQLLRGVWSSRLYFCREHRSVDAAEKAWATYCEAFEGQSEPWDKVGTVKSWPKTCVDLTTYTFIDMESIKTEKQRLATIEKDYDLLLARVRDQEDRLSSAFSKKT